MPQGCLHLASACTWLYKAAQRDPAHLQACMSPRTRARQLPPALLGSSERRVMGATHAMWPETVAAHHQMAPTSSQCMRTCSAAGGVWRGARRSSATARGRAACRAQGRHAGHSRGAQARRRLGWQAQPRGHLLHAMHVRVCAAPVPAQGSLQCGLAGPSDALRMCPRDMLRHCAALA